MAAELNSRTLYLLSYGGISAGEIKVLLYSFRKRFYKPNRIFSFNMLDDYVGKTSDKELPNSDTALPVVIKCRLTNGSVESLK